VLAVYREGIFLRLPVVATDLVPSERRPPSKLTVPALTELVALAERSRVLCPSPPTPSGSASAAIAENASSPS
jgi:hypothetical protein